MENAAGSETVARGGVRTGELNEPVRATGTRYFVNGLRSSRRAEEDRRYSWLEDYLDRLDGKELRQDYYVGLEE